MKPTTSSRPRSVLHALLFVIEDHKQTSAGSQWSEKIAAVGNCRCCSSVCLRGPILPLNAVTLKPVASSPRELFHYTTAQGLLGMLQSNSLRATNALYMNDASERRHGNELLSVVLGENAKHARSPVFKSYSWAVETVAYVLSASSVCVFCLTAQRNQLSQWRAYAANGGYCIGFHTDGLRALLNRKRLVAGTYKSEGLYKVVYGATMQTRLFERAIRESFSRYTSSNRSPTRPHTAETPRTRSTLCSRPCPASASPASRRCSAGTQAAWGEPALS